jgi:hypothetical protein
MAWRRPDLKAENGRPGLQADAAPSKRAVVAFGKPVNLRRQGWLLALVDGHKPNFNIICQIL